ncbi:hypothetical protein [Massilia sp. BKSP1R2A-1]|uniref:hypothetical protein n=1 Tax=Massilia sp. BKSP1R2A-1 TaxID=3422595 RepID=UPI003D334D34
MTNFLSSLKKGLSSAMISRNEQIEIDEVVEDLNQQMLSLSDQMIGVGIRSFIRQTEKKTSSASILSPHRYKALCLLWTASNDRAAVHEFAEWFQADEGYPVKIFWKNVSHTCTSREAIEQVLVKITSDATFGIVVRDILIKFGKNIIETEDDLKITSTPGKQPSAKKATQKMKA